MHLVMGTAGHIDHGKTTLVKALTGIDCDRLAEEKKRGITIELGFAHLDLPSGDRLGVVDVPGHERFVKNMVAGAQGIDFVLLVIAADEGIMPQTREHLEICELLGISTGLVALTKADTVDAEWLDMVTEEVREFLAPTFLAEAPVMAVSAHTGAGLDELKGALDALASGLSTRSRPDLMRLPVDRVFTMKGFGTVVTGTLVAGTIEVGEDLALFPSGLTAKVRGAQSHGEAVQTAPAGRRTAVNLQGVEVPDVHRGDVLARPHTLFPATAWDVSLTCLKSSPRPIKHRKELHFHHGTRDVLARVYFLDRDELNPGETAVCQVRFSEPLVGVYGDRVVLRSFSPLRAVAGGVLINPLAERVKRHSDTVTLLAGLAGADLETRVRFHLELAGTAGATLAQLKVRTGLGVKALDKSLQSLGGSQAAHLVDKTERRYLSGVVVDHAGAAILGHLQAFHKREPMKPGLARTGLTNVSGADFDPKVLHFLVERLVKRGELASDGEVVRLPDHEVSMAGDQAALSDAVLSAYRAGGRLPPNLKDVLGPLNVTDKQARPVLNLLVERGDLVKVTQDMFFATGAMDELLGLVRGYFEDNEELSAPAFKDLTGLSRKFAIPLLEYFDRSKITVRVGDVRRLRRA